MAVNLLGQIKLADIHLFDTLRGTTTTQTTRIWKTAKSIKTEFMAVNDRTHFGHGKTNFKNKTKNWNKIYPQDRLRTNSFHNNCRIEFPYSSGVRQYGFKLQMV